MSTFKAFVATQTDGKFAASFQQLDRSALPAGEVLVKVAYSSLNYKDGLAVTGKPGVIRKFPMVPGVDFAGWWKNPLRRISARAMRWWSPDAERRKPCGAATRNSRAWMPIIIVPPSQRHDAAQSMAIGTAGFTAMQSVMALEAHGLKAGGKRECW